MKKMTAMTGLSTLCILHFAVANAAEIGEPIVIGERVEIHSEILDEDRSLLIGKPAGYDENDERYAVMILLDGESNFHHTTGLVTFLAETGRIPPMLVVGVENTVRTRDLTPPTQTAEDLEGLGAHGGADNFRAFISSELLPWIDENYRTRPYRMLVGHSFGGLFALHAVISQPDLFDAYIAISPSLWWDDQGLVDQLQAFVDTTDTMDTALFITMGNESGGMLGGTRKFSGVLDENAPDGLRWDFRLLDQETHGSVPHRSTYLGLEMIFDGWFLPDIMEYYDAHGLEGIFEHYRRIGERFGYDHNAPAEELSYLGEQLVTRGRLEEAEAIVALDRDIYRAPPWLLAELGDAYLEQDQAETAIDYYKRVIERNPGSTDVKRKLTEQGIDVEALVPTVGVSADVLAAYVGRFNFDDGTTIVFTVEEGALFGAPDWDSKGELHAQSDVRFYFEGVDTQVTFEPDESGAVDVLVLDWFGEPYAGKRGDN